jgi:SMC interacting uncharacterized protein involved in chromosome segregation
MNNEDFYHDAWNKAYAFQDSYGHLMNAVDEAFELSRQRLADEEELRRLREESKQHYAKVRELQDKIAEINRTFIDALASETGRVIAERDAAVKDAAMWKKSYEDLTKCL